MLKRSTRVFCVFDPLKVFGTLGVPWFVSGNVKKTHPRFEDILKKVKKLPLQPTKPTKSAAASHAPLVAQPKEFKGRKTLILDLDETVYAPDYIGNPKALRPYHREFLDCACSLFEVIVWTRSSGHWPDVKVKALNFEPVHILRGWDDCDSKGRKELWKFQRDPSQIFLADDDLSHWSANPRSQLIVPMFDPGAKRGGDDDVLLKLIPLLERIHKAATVQDVFDEYIADSVHPAEAEGKNASEKKK